MMIPPAIRSMTSGVFGRLRGFGSTRASSPAPAVATSISISPASAKFALGKTQTYTASVLDQFGQDMGLAVTWSSNSANVTINSSTGVATGAAYGNATLTATYQSLTNTAAATCQQPTKLAIVTQPAGATSGSAFTTQPVVELQDVSSQQDAESGRTVTVSLLSGAGTLSGTTSVVTDSNGRAVFADLAITATTPPSDFTLAFACTGLTGVNASAITVASSTSFWLANKPAGWTQRSIVDFSTVTIPAGDSGSIGGGWVTLSFAGQPWDKLADCWRLTKVPGYYDSVGTGIHPVGSGADGADGGHSWGKFYLASIPNFTGQKYYVVIETMWQGQDATTDYEWHPISNKWFEEDWPSNFLLVQSQEGGRWQNLENLGFDYHPANTLSNAAIPSNQKTVFEMIVEHDVPRVRTWRDGTALTNETGAQIATAGNTGELYFNNFDGGGAMNRFLTSYIRYYRMAIYTP